MGRRTWNLWIFAYFLSHSSAINHYVTAPPFILLKIESLQLNSKTKSLHMASKFKEETLEPLKKSWSNFPVSFFLGSLVFKPVGETRWKNLFSPQTSLNIPSEAKVWDFLAWDVVVSKIELGLRTFFCWMSSSTCGLPYKKCYSMMTLCIECFDKFLPYRLS